MVSGCAGGVVPPLGAAASPAGGIVAFCVGVVAGIVGSEGAAAPEDSLWVGVLEGKGVAGAASAGAGVGSGSLAAICVEPLGSFRTTAPPALEDPVTCE
jgi:hypothetical protein